jgi:hypothetical protein
MNKPLALEQLVASGAIDRIIQASVWSATPVSARPKIDLEAWQVMQLPGGDRHFVGWNATEGECRASSKIVAFDAVTRRGRTSSGRVYQLSGRTGRDGDGLHTWGRWMRINGVTEFADVSAEVQGLIDAAREGKP